MHGYDTHFCMKITATAVCGNAMTFNLASYPKYLRIDDLSCKTTSLMREGKLVSLLRSYSNTMRVSYIDLFLVNCQSGVSNGTFSCSDGKDGLSDGNLESDSICPLVSLLAA